MGYFLKTKGCVGSEPKGLHSVLIRGCLKSKKLVFLKNLKVFAKLLGLETVEDILLVDDGPEKNLLNDVHSVVHPPTWSGDDEDRFITR